MKEKEKKSGGKERSQMQLCLTHKYIEYKNLCLWYLDVIFVYLGGIKKILNWYNFVNAAIFW